MESVVTVAYFIWYQGNYYMHGGRIDNPKFLSDCAQKTVAGVSAALEYSFATSVL